jgi:hypothetical protein
MIFIQPKNPEIQDEEHWRSFILIQGVLNMPKMSKAVGIKETDNKKYLWEEVLEEFILTKKAEGRAWRTIDDYRTHNGRFFSRYP